MWQKENVRIFIIASSLIILIISVSWLLSRNAPKFIETPDLGQIPSYNIQISSPRELIPSSALESRTPDISANEENTLFIAKWEENGKTDIELLAYDKTAEKKPVFFVPRQVALALLGKADRCKLETINSIEARVCSASGIKMFFLDIGRYRLIAWGNETSDDYDDVLNSLATNIKMVRSYE